jgi:prepilin-type N-terminal cleavage/methylation domain-containing protein
MKNRQIKKSKTRGFTLVELMVSTSIFAIIMLASIGSLFTLLGASKNSRAKHTALDNVNFALESMTRSIRMGKNYICTPEGSLYPTTLEGSLIPGRDCQDNEAGTAISFLPQSGSGDLTTYKLSSRYDDSFTLERCVSDNCVQIISDDVNIKYVNFLVKGTGTSLSKRQPNVFIKLKGEVKVKEESVPFNIQTFINQRNY